MLPSKLLAGLVALGLALLAVELGLRWVLFGGAGDGFWRLRQPRAYADARDDEVYWRLRHRLEGAPLAGPPPHPRLGWVSDALDPRTLEHSRRGELAGRRPLLLYGDSYARCNTAPEGCFEALLEASSLGGRLALQNHGVRGYGLDQIWLLLADTLERYLPARPVVVVGVFVDEDLDRCLLGLRELPKPRLWLEDGALVEPDEPLPSLEQALEGGVGARSYAWRLLLQRWRPAGAGRRQAETTALAAALLDAICARLEAAGVPCLFVLFHGQDSLAVEGTDADWRHALVAAELERRGLPWISARELLRADMALTGRAPAAYFGTEGLERGHYNALGNRVVFAGLARALEPLLER